jgi:hypothetical protein
MAPRIERDDEHPVASETRQSAIMAIGAALLVIGSAIVSALAAQGWRWDVGMLAVLLIVEGIDCLYVGITGRNGASPILFAWWPMI